MPVSMTATGTPLPVLYCQAWLMLSRSKPGAICETSGVFTVIGAEQLFARRIGWSGRDGPSGGTAPGSTLGGEIAWAAGIFPAIAIKLRAAMTATARVHTGLSGEAT